MNEIIEKLDIIITLVEDLTSSVARLEDKLNRAESRLIHLENINLPEVAKRFNLCQ